MASIFTKIIAGDIPCYKIGETENCFAFLDISPLAEGHVLVIPKVEVDLIFDLDPVVYNELHLFAKSIAQAIKKVISCERVGMAVIGLEVPHAHIHLVPINTIGDLSFNKTRVELKADQFAKIAKSIADQL